MKRLVTLTQLAVLCPPLHSVNHFQKLIMNYSLSQLLAFKAIVLFLNSHFTPSSFQFMFITFGLPEINASACSFGDIINTGVKTINSSMVCFIPQWEHLNDFAPKYCEAEGAAPSPPALKSN